MSRRAVLIIADFFPPSTAVGAQRTAGLCRHLTRTGWHVTVITTRQRPGDAADAGLEDSVPSGIRVIRPPAADLPAIAERIFKRSRPGAQTTPAAAEGESKASASHRLIDWMSWWIHVPDARTGWLVPALAAGLAEARRRPPDVIFSSAPMWTSHVTAALLSRILHAPLVADFRDPWCGSPWRNIPYSAHRRVDTHLEAFVLASANRITCAWEGIRKHLAGRYPRKGPDIVTIRNGFDLQRVDSIEPINVDSGRCVLVHTGTFYGPRSPIPLLRALHLLKDRSPRKAENVLAVLMGAPTYRGRSLSRLAAENEVAEMVRVIPAASHGEALALIKSADVAMLFGQSGSDALASVPAKTYDYIGAGKAVLAIGAGREAVAVVRRGGCRLWCAKSPKDIAAALENILKDFRSNELSGQADPNARLAFTREKMAEDITAVLAAAIRGGKKKWQPKLSCS